MRTKAGLGAAAALLACGLAALLWLRAPQAAPQTPEAAALRFFDALMARRDEAAAQAMLCQEGIQYHRAVVSEQARFWSGPDVLAAPHGFRVARTASVDRGDPSLPPVTKVWVGFSYRYRSQGVARDLEEQGLAVSVMREPGGLCVAPWAGER